MKKTTIITASLLLCGFGAHADEQSALTKSSSSSGLSENYAGHFGAGIILGEPSGVSAKYFLNDTLAIDGAAGWSLHEDSDFYFQGDLLFHKFDLIHVSKGQMPVYIGGGAFVRFRDERHDNEAGIRVPVGISYMFEDAPIDIFAEIAPGLDLTPSTRADFTGGVGIRFWF